MTGWLLIIVLVCLTDVICAVPGMPSVRMRWRRRCRPTMTRPTASRIEPVTTKVMPISNNAGGTAPTAEPTTTAAPASAKSAPMTTRNMRRAWQARPRTTVDSRLSD